MTSSIGLGVPFFVAAILFSTADGQSCTFPSELHGTWLSGARGNITITNEYIFNFELSYVGAKTFQCQEMYGDRYIVKTTNTFSYIDPTLIFSALMCMDFRYITTDLYYFYLGSNHSLPERAYFNLNDLTVAPEVLCAVSPDDYNVQAYEVMIKNGNIDAAKLPCPTDLQKYWAYNFDSGSGNLCTSDRSMDVCEADQVYFNYTQCSTKIAYSSSGVLNCVVNVTTGSTTYVTLYNNDSTVDDSTTYRFSCWAFSKVGNDLQMTQNPRSCSEQQNSTNVDMALGAHIYLFNGIITTPADLTWLYITLGCLFGVFFITAIIVFFYFFSKYKAKQKPFRGGLEPANMSPRGPHLMNGHALTFKPSPGIPENDAPVNVMKLLRKDLATPVGRNSPSSNFNVTINTPPQLFNIREIDSYGPSPSRESPNQRKDYHVLGGADQSEYGDLPLEDDRTSHTPVMVLPMTTKSSFTVEEMEDDYDDDDDEFLTTPGRSRLVAASQGMNGFDPMCPATRLPGIAEDVAITSNDRFRVGGGRPLASSGASNITFLNEFGMPLPPRTPTPPGAVETVRDKNSKLRVKSTRIASLTKGSKKAEGVRGEMDTSCDPRGPQGPERGDDPDKIEMVITLTKPDKKLAPLKAPSSARSPVKKGAKPSAALLRSRSAILDYRRGEQAKHDSEDDAPDADHDEKNNTKNNHKIEVKIHKNLNDDVKQVQSPRQQHQSPRQQHQSPRQHQSPKQQHQSTRQHPSPSKQNHPPKHNQPPKQNQPLKQIQPSKQSHRPKTSTGHREGAAKESSAETRHSPRTGSVADAEEPVTRPTSSLRLTRVDIPDLSPPAVATGNKTSQKSAGIECVDAPGRLSLKNQEGVIEEKSSKMWLDPVRPGANVWGQMSSAWREGQAWTHSKK